MSETCGKGLHEMTPENSYTPPNGKRVWCRACMRDRLRLSKQRKENGVTVPRESKLDTTAMDARLAKNPPVIEYRRVRGVMVPVSINDPHTKNPRGQR